MLDAVLNKTIITVWMESVLFQLFISVTPSTINVICRKSWGHTYPTVLSEKVCGYMFQLHTFDLTHGKSWGHTYLSVSGDDHMQHLTEHSKLIQLNTWWWKTDWLACDSSTLKSEVKICGYVSALYIQFKIWKSWGHTHLTVLRDDHILGALDCSKLIQLKMHGPIFKPIFKIYFFVLFEETSSQREREREKKIIFQLKRTSCLNIGSKYQYVHCSCLYLFCANLIMVTITRHVFINIFQTEHFSAIKCDMGYEKNMNFLVISLKKVWKKVLKIGLGLFKHLKEKWLTCMKSSTLKAG